MMNKRLKVKLDNVFYGVKTEDITAPFAHVYKKEETKPFLLIPADQSYVEICGHRIDEVKSFEDFMEYLHQRVQIEKDYADLYNDRAAFIEYLKVKLEEGRLMATYENGIRYPSAQERIYEDILNRVESGNYE